MCLVVVGCLWVGFVAINLFGFGWLILLGLGTCLLCLRCIGLLAFTVCWWLGYLLFNSVD